MRALYESLSATITPLYRGDAYTGSVQTDLLSVRVAKGQVAIHALRRGVVYRWSASDAVEREEKVRGRQGRRRRARRAPCEVRLVQWQG